MATRAKEDRGSRTVRHRRRQALRGTRRVEVTVPDEDVELVRHLAAALRAGGDEAEGLRAQLRTMSGFRPARSGDELVAFFRRSPLVGEDLDVQRDRSPGRPIDL